MVGGKQAHHDPRRAEAALRGVSVNHRLLQRMQFGADGEILDRDELGAVELAQEQNAGVERLIGEPTAPEPRQHHRARAAISLGAALLRSLRSHVLPQPIEDGRARGELSKFNISAAKMKAKRIPRGSRYSLKRHRRS
jgi:hypothetical protein